jgi:hypothetical protein
MLNGIEIVIARYNEDLKWTLYPPFNQFKFTVYNKGPNDNFEKTKVDKIIKLPNIGREGHTYLHHIIQNYNNLADITVFLPGSAGSPIYDKFSKAKNLIYKILKFKRAFMLGYHVKDLSPIVKFQINHYASSHPQNLKQNPESNLELSKLRPLGNWYNHFFGNKPINCITGTGIFSIHKFDVIKHPVSRYQLLIHTLSKSSNPEVGHYIERLWQAVFYPLNFTDILYTNSINTQIFKKMIQKIH